MQLATISPYPAICYQGEKTNPHLTTTSLQRGVEGSKVPLQPPVINQAKQPHVPHLLLIKCT